MVLFTGQYLPGNYGNRYEIIVQHVKFIIQNVKHIIQILMDKGLVIIRVPKEPGKKN